MGGIKVGIIGGTGMHKVELFKLREEKEVTTPYGNPSSSLSCGTLCDVECVLLNRHGNGHHVIPTRINYRANIFALKEEGCTHVIATSACGSLKEEMVPGDFVITDQIIDRTTKREATFYDGQPGSLEGVCHIPMKHPFCERLREVLAECCKHESVRYHSSGTAVTIEGPRFSSYAESHLYRSWGGSVINMTTFPEVVLAKEMGLLYAVVAMVTDYDCWRDDHDAVNVAHVMKIMKENREKAIKVVGRAVEVMGSMDWEKDIEECQATAKASVIN